MPQRLKSIMRGAALVPLLLILSVHLACAGVIQEMDGTFKSAQIHFTLGDTSKALDMFKELRKRDSTFRGREVQLYIAKCYEALAHLDDAYREYERFIAKYPNSPSVPLAMIKLIAIGKAIGKKYDPEQLTQQLWKAVQESSPQGKAPMLYNLALLEREASEITSAQLFESEVVEKYPNSVGAFWLSH
jgi:outer membrane protein assembly factor BamD (BamD/ComL family)